MFWNFTYNTHCFCCYGIESADRQPKMYCYWKSTAYKNKSLSNWLLALNARKYVRCSRTFYCYLLFPNVEFTPSGPYNPNSLWSDAFRESQTMDKSTRAGLWIYGQQNVRAYKRHHWTEPRQRTHTQSLDGDSNLWSHRESNPDRKVGREGLYRPLHGDGW